MSLESLVDIKKLESKIIKSSPLKRLASEHIIESDLKNRIFGDKGNYRIVQTNFVNTSSKSHKFAAIVVMDLFIPGLKAEKVLTNGWLNTSRSEYVSLNFKSRTNNLLMQRDYNFHSFDKRYGYLKNSIVSEWYTEIVLGKESLVIGAITTKDYFSQVFVKQKKSGLRIRVTCQLDDVIVGSKQKIASEKIALILDRRQSALSGFSRLVSLFAKSSMLVPKEINGLNCAYYDRGNDVDEEYVLAQLNVINSLKVKPKFNYIQLDAGYSDPWGDWFKTESKFPGGLKSIVGKIHQSGFKAGIWVAPFIASPTSDIFKNNPHWFLKDLNEKYIEGRGCSPFDGMGFLSFKVLDVTNDQVLDYIQFVAKKFKDFGFDMLKIDFTYPIHLKNNYYNNKYTRAQIVRRAYQAVRQGVGNETLLLSGISHLSPLVGVVNSARVEYDSTEPFFFHKGYFSTLKKKRMYKRD